jgi:glutamate-1-semialdehyde 2,1-aminomutase
VNTIATASIAALVALVPAIRYFRARIALSRAKHRSLTGHARWSRRLAALIPYYEYDATRFYRVDGAPQDIAARRRQTLSELGSRLQTRSPVSLALTMRVRPMLPDLEFTAAYRVPFQFRAELARHVSLGAFVAGTHDGLLQDLDGNETWDLGGSYGVNVFGYDFYKACIDEGVQRAGALGPVLGPYHPDLAYNLERLCEISGHDAVSFHMSGTEAVMQAVRLARYHTRRTHLVRFCGAYHGWWGDVQPGIGNPVPAPYTYTLAEMHERSLHVLRTRRDIACVLVNPLQALHPNAAAPGDGSLLDGSRQAHFDRARYTAWLRQLREVCSERGIVLIFDEVFLGFRLAPGGAQEYFDVRADMVTYGKTVAGGLPIGVICGRRDLMRRYRDARPADICFARGTFNSHPCVMTTMAVFLRRLLDDDIVETYKGLDARWNARAAQFNDRLAGLGLPVRCANLSSIWTLCYTIPSPYHWLFQFYLRDAGVHLAWTGTGRLIFNINLSDRAFDAITERFVSAAEKMRDAGWWWQPPGATRRRIKRRLALEILRARLGLHA